MTKPFPAVIPPDVQARFWAKVDVRSPEECWEWQGPLTPKGYARPYLPGLRSVSAHRFAYYLKNGEAPPDLVADHLCRNRRCVNPQHIRLVSNRVNVLTGIGPAAQNARKTHCVRGHALTLENVRVRPRPDGTVSRECRLCMRVRNEARDRRRNKPSEERAQ